MRLRARSHGRSRRRWASWRGLQALSVGVGLGVVHELMEAEVTEVAGPKGGGTPSGRRGSTATRTAR